MDSVATFGIYRSESEVNKAISLMDTLGLGRSRMSMLFPDHPGETETDFEQIQKNEAFRYAKVGGALGFVAIATIAILSVTGILNFGHVTSITNPMTLGYQTTMVIGGCLLGLLFGVGAGTMIGIGTPKRAGQRHGQYVHAGGILMSVRSLDNTERSDIETAFEKSGAQDISSVDEKQGWSDVLSEKSLLDHESPS